MGKRRLPDVNVLRAQGKAGFPTSVFLMPRTMLPALLRMMVADSLLQLSLKQPFPPSLPPTPLSLTLPLFASLLGDPSMLCLKLSR